ncbi:MAG: tripartite tricarboxylate transporter substrate binding protein [Burkholderiales bacterium]|nr:tripartite tricarboxylate transporter substrate binding protein [Burkholderiales bacterium]
MHCVSPRLAAVLAALLLAGSAFAQAFPSRPITLVVGFAPGGATDVQARALAQLASKELGQPVVVENRPGVSGTLGPTSAFQRAAADGYTLGVLPGTLYRVPHMMKLAYDPLKDFTYIANVTQYVYSLSVARDSRFRNLGELVAYAKANPGKLSFATTGVGGSGHISVMRFARAAGIEVTPVPYKGAAEAFTAVLGGHVDFTAEGGFGALADSGKIRSLGIFSEARLKSRPVLPTVREQGFDVVARMTWGVGGPKGMDPKVVAVLGNALRKAMHDPSFVQVLEREDQPLAYMDSADYTAFATQMFHEEGRFVQALGIKTE